MSTVFHLLGGSEGENQGASPLGPPPPSPPPMTAEQCDELPAKMGTVPEIPPELEAALQASGEQLVVELQALEEMPQVKLTPASVYDRAKPAGSVANKRGVICKLLCCGGQPGVKCNDKSGPGACPTHVEAARQLRANVARDHGSEACLEKARQSRASQGTSCAAVPESAFAVMLDAAVSKQRAASALRRAEEQAALQNSRALHAAQEAEAAAANLSAAQEEARRVGLLGAKKQRTEKRPPHFEKYSAYNESQWLSTTGELMNRRAKEPKAGVKAAGPRDGASGALEHWRRGLVGCVQDWADGSLDNVVILISRLISHFEVQEKVLEKLAGKPPKAHRNRHSQAMIRTHRPAPSFHRLSSHRPAPTLTNGRPSPWQGRGLRRLAWTRALSSALSMRLPCCAAARPSPSGWRWVSYCAPWRRSRSSMVTARMAWWVPSLDAWEAKGLGCSPTSAWCAAS